MGVTPTGPGCEPTASAADASSQSRIPNAGTLVFGALHSIDFGEGTVTIKARDIPPLAAGAYVIVSQEVLYERGRQAETTRERYEELLFAVARKYPGETRHATALRYITEREAASGIEARSDETPKAAQPAGQEPDPKGDAQTTVPPVRSEP